VHLSHLRQQVHTEQNTALSDDMIDINEMASTLYEGLVKYCINNPGYNQETVWYNSIPFLITN